MAYAHYEITKDEKYKQIVSELAEGIIVAGAPKYNSWGFWNSNCTCCGAPGLIEFFAEMYEFFAEDKYLRYARDAAARVIGDLFMTSEGRVHYGSWDRTNPKAIESFTGLYTGAAGAGASLLKLYSVLMNEKIEPLWEYSYL